MSVCFAIYEIIGASCILDFLLDHPEGGHWAMTISVQHILSISKSNCFTSV